jgi:hypothetical protein
MAAQAATHALPILPAHCGDTGAASKIEYCHVLSVFSMLCHAWAAAYAAVTNF